MPLTVDDVACCDCGGAVEAFAVPDAVWDGLGYKPGDFACVACTGRRLNPELDPQIVRGNWYWIKKELHRQRRKFGLNKPPYRCMGELSPALFLEVVADELTSIPRVVMICRGDEAKDMEAVKSFKTKLRVSF